MEQAWGGSVHAHLGGAGRRFGCRPWRGELSFSLMSDQCCICSLSSSAEPADTFMGGARERPLPTTLAERQAGRTGGLDGRVGPAPSQPWKLPLRTASRSRPCAAVGRPFQMMPCRWRSRSSALRHRVGLAQLNMFVRMYVRRWRPPAGDRVDRRGDRPTAGQEPAGRDPGGGGGGGSARQRHPCGVQGGP